MEDCIHHKRPARSRRACLLLTAMVLVSGALATACGGRSAIITATTVGIGPTSQSRIRFSNCMRANGVTNFPDLSGDGTLIRGTGQTMSVNGVSVNAPTYLNARARCQRYLPSRRSSARQSAQQRERGLRFARCMRSHGVPSFPDPKTITLPDGTQAAYLPGVDVQSPAFQAGAKACGGGPKGP